MHKFSKKDIQFLRQFEFSFCTLAINRPFLDLMRSAILSSRVFLKLKNFYIYSPYVIPRTIEQYLILSIKPLDCTLSIIIHCLENKRIYKTINDIPLETVYSLVESPLYETQTIY